MSSTTSFHSHSRHTVTLPQGNNADVYISSENEDAVSDVDMTPVHSRNAGTEEEYEEDDDFTDLGDDDDFFSFRDIHASSSSPLRTHHIPVLGDDHYYQIRSMETHTDFFVMLANAKLQGKPMIVHSQSKFDLLTRDAAMRFWLNKVGETLLQPHFEILLKLTGLEQNDVFRQFYRVQMTKCHL